VAHVGVVFLGRWGCSWGVQLHSGCVVGTNLDECGWRFDVWWMEVKAGAGGRFPFKPPSKAQRPNFFTESWQFVEESSKVVHREPPINPFIPF
jgi:hypothetical protein